MQILHYQELESTQLKARELLVKNPVPFVVIADLQKSGKASKGRSWYSPKGGLYMTLALELDFNLLDQDMLQFSQESCQWVVKVLRDFLPKYFTDADLSALQIKGINDLYFKEAKLAGVLMESLNNRDKSLLLIGIGLNVYQADFADLDKLAVSLEDILPRAELLKYNVHDFAAELALELADSVRTLSNYPGS